MRFAPNRASDTTDRRIDMPRHNWTLLLLLLLLVAAARPALADPLRLTEVVTDPQTDHSENTGGNGLPFDLIPGSGTISTVDEFVEIANVGARAIDLTGYVLDFVDTTPSSYTFGATAGGVLLFSSGSTVDALLPGGFVLLGNPPGSLNNAIDVFLRDPGGVEADRLSVADGNAASALDEAVARLWDGVYFLDATHRVPVTPLAPGAPVPEPDLWWLAGLSALACGRATARRVRRDRRHRPAEAPRPPSRPREAARAGATLLNIPGDPRGTW